MAAIRVDAGTLLSFEQLVNACIEGRGEEHVRANGLPEIRRAKMTYRELEVYIATLSDEQKDCDVSVYLDGEYLEVSACAVTDEDDDVLDENHPVLIIKD